MNGYTMKRFQLEGFAYYAAKYKYLNNPFAYWVYSYYFKRSF